MNNANTIEKEYITSVSKRVITYAAVHFMQVLGRIIVIVVEYKMPKDLHDPYVWVQVGH